ncbi:hypothetical protein SLS58_006462 [Diplodia intermedia]|uniref:Uncharacterized protein n=1 Tax=Diplodia intermedia TaxID=856260 RepID=A0ABR3TN46_9PEZI
MDRHRLGKEQAFTGPDVPVQQHGDIGSRNEDPEATYQQGVETYFPPNNPKQPAIGTEGLQGTRDTIDTACTPADSGHDFAAGAFETTETLSTTGVDGTVTEPLPGVSTVDSPESIPRAGESTTESNPTAPALDFETSDEAGNGSTRSETTIHAANESHAVPLVTSPPERPEQRERADTTGRLWKLRGYEKTMWENLKEEMNRLWDADSILRKFSRSEPSIVPHALFRRRGDEFPAKFHIHVLFAGKEKVTARFVKVMKANIVMEDYTTFLTKQTDHKHKYTPKDIQFKRAPLDLLWGLLGGAISDNIETCGQPYGPFSSCGLMFHVGSRVGTIGGLVFADDCFYMLTTKHTFEFGPDDDSLHDDTSDDDMWNESCSETSVLPPATSTSPSGDCTLTRGSTRLEGLGLSNCCRDWSSGSVLTSQTSLMVELAALTKESKPQSPPQPNNTPTPPWADGKPRSLPPVCHVESIQDAEEIFPRACSAPEPADGSRSPKHKTETEVMVSSEGSRIDEMATFPEAEVTSPAIRLEIESTRWTSPNASDWALVLAKPLLQESGKWLPISGRTMNAHFVNVAEVSESSSSTEKESIYVGELIDDETVDQVFILTGRGVLRGKMISSASSDPKGYIQLQGPNIRKSITLSHCFDRTLTLGAVEKGDSGSWVIDVRTKKLCGVLVAAYLSVKIGVFERVSIMKKDIAGAMQLRYSESEQHVGGGVHDHVCDDGNCAMAGPTPYPTKEHRISLLPEAWNLLPTNLDALVSYAMSGNIPGLRSFYERTEKSLSRKELSILMDKAVLGGNADAVRFLKKQGLDGSAHLLCRQAGCNLDLCNLLLNTDDRLDLESARDAVYGTLHVAAASGNLEVINAWLSSNTDKELAEREDLPGYSPLDFAVMAKHTKAVQILVEHYRTWRSASKLLGRSLRLATTGPVCTTDSEVDETRRKEVLDTILAAVPEAVQESKLYYEALRAAAESGRTLLLSTLLKEVPRPVEQQHQRQLERCLCLAASFGHVDTVAFLISHSVDPNSQNDRKIPAFHSACKAGELEAVRLLLNFQTEQTWKQRTNGKTAFQWAVSKGHEGVVRLLMDPANFPSNGCTDTEDHRRCFTPDLDSETFHLACASGNVAVVKLLLDHQTVPLLEGRNRVNRTPLQQSASSPNADIVRTLLSVGADATARCRSGTPLEIAAAKGHIGNVEAILEMKPDCEVSQKALLAAAGSTKSPEGLVNILLDRCRPGDQLRFLKATLGRRRYPWMTRRLLQRNDMRLDFVDVDFVRQLVSRSEREVVEKIPKQHLSLLQQKQMLVASAKNIVDGLEMTRYLMDLHECAPGFDLTLLKVAAANEVYGAELVDYLLDFWGNGFREELTELLEDAIQNARWAPDILKHLFRCISPNKVLISGTTIRRLAANWAARDKAMKTLIEEHCTQFSPSVLPELLLHFPLDIIEGFLDKFLSNRQPHDMFDEDGMRYLFAQAARNNGCESIGCNEECTTDLIRMMQRRGFKTSWTADMLEDVRDNKKHGPSLMRHICGEQEVPLGYVVPGFDIPVVRKAMQSSNKEPRVSPCVFRAALKDPTYDTKLISVLLHDSTKQETEDLLTEDMLVTAVGNSGQATALVELLLEKCRASSITEAVVQAAVESSQSADSLFRLLRKKLGDPGVAELVTERVVTAVLRNWEKAPKVIPQLAECTKVLDIDRVEAFDAAKRLDCKTLMTLLDAPFNIRPSQSLLQAVAGNFDHGAEAVALLLDGFPDLLGTPMRVLKPTMEAILSNWTSAPQILESLRKRGPFPWTVTEDILVLAAQNPLSGVQIMTMLLNEEDAARHITPLVLAAAAANVGCAKALLRRLLREIPAEMVTTQVVVAAAKNGSCGLHVLQELVECHGAAVFTRSVLLAAALNTRKGAIGVAVPLSRGHDLHITPEKIRHEVNNYTMVVNPPFVAGGSGAAIFRAGARATTERKQLVVRWELPDGTTETKALLRIEQEWIWRDGCHIVEWLLRREELQSAVQELATTIAYESNAHILRTILRHGVTPTEQLLEVAVKNMTHGVEVTTALLDWSGDHGVGVCITDTALLNAARNEKLGWAILPLLLRHDVYRRVPIVVVDAALDREWMDETCLRLLLERIDCKMSRAVLARRAIHATSNGRAGVGLADYILDLCEKAGDISANDQRTQQLITELMVAAVANTSSGSDIYRMISWRYGGLARDRDAIAEVAVKNIRQSCLLLRQMPIEPTSSLLQLAATNKHTGDALMEWLLTQPGAVQKLEPATLVAAAHNTANGERLVHLILAAKQDPADLVTPEVLQAAASNWRHGPAVVRMLLRFSDPDLVDSSVLRAAAGNTGCGPALLRLLLEASTSGTASDSVREAACENIRYGYSLLQAGGILGPPSQTTFSMILSAARNQGCGCDLLDELLPNTEFAAPLLDKLLRDGIEGRLDSVVAVALRHDAMRNREVRVDVLWRLDTDTIDDLIRASHTLKIMPPPKESWTAHVPACFALDRLRERGNRKLRKGADLTEWIFQAGSDHECFIPKDIPLEWLARYPGKPFALRLAKQRLISETNATAGLLETAIEKKNHDMVELLLEHCASIQITVAEAQQAAGQPSTFALLLAHSPHLASAESVLKAAAPYYDSLKKLLETHPRNRVAQSVLEAAVADVRSLKRLFRDCPASVVNESVVLASVPHAESLGFLLQRSPKLKITERILKKALEYPATLRLLFANDNRPLPRITEAVLADATKNVTALCFLLDRSSAFIASESILLGAIKNNNRASLMVLLHRDREAEISEAILLEAVPKYGLMKILLEQHPFLDLTEEVINKAAGHGLPVFRHLVSRDESPPASELTLERASLSVCQWLLAKSPRLRVTDCVLQASKDDPAKFVFLLQKRPDVTPSCFSPDRDRAIEFLDSFQRMVLRTQELKSRTLQLLLRQPQFEVRQDNVLSLLRAFPGPFAHDVIMEYLSSNRSLITDALLKTLLQREDAIDTISVLESEASEQPPIPISDEVVQVTVARKPTHFRAIISLLRTSKAFSLSESGKAICEEVINGKPVSDQYAATALPSPQTSQDGVHLDESAFEERSDCCAQSLPPMENCPQKARRPAASNNKTPDPEDPESDSDDPVSDPPTSECYRSESGTGATSYGGGSVC